MDRPETPVVPDGYRIYEMASNWFIPERYDAQRNMWRHFDKGTSSYYWHKTWNGAYRFIERKIARKG